MAEISERLDKLEGKLDWLASKMMDHDAAIYQLQHPRD